MKNKISVEKGPLEQLSNNTQEKDINHKHIYHEFSASFEDKHKFPKGKKFYNYLSNIDNDLLKYQDNRDSPINDFNSNINRNLQ